MRKLKIILITMAIVVSIGGSFASTQQDGCVYSTQYHLVGGSYLNAGEYGYDFYCLDDPANTCTYYKPNPGVEVYIQCRSGDYQVIPHLKKSK